MNQNYCDMIKLDFCISFLAPPQKTHPINQLPEIRVTHRSLICMPGRSCMINNTDAVLFDDTRRYNIRVNYVEGRMDKYILWTTKRMI